MSDHKEMNIPLKTVADTAKSETEVSKEDFAFLKIKKENKNLKFENAELREKLSAFRDRALERTFLENGGRKNAFPAFKKANAELLADGDEVINGKQVKKEQDYFFANESATSSNDGIVEKQDDGLAGMTIDLSKGEGKSK